MIKVVTVRHLKPVSKILEQLFVQLRNGVFPIKLFVNVQEIERQHITIADVIDIECIVVVLKEVLIVIFKMVIFSFDGFILNQLFSQFTHLFNHHGLSGLLVSLTRI